MADERCEAYGLAASAQIPVATYEEIDAGYCLRFMRQVRDCSFATVDEHGLPSVRVIDVMHAGDGRLYFLAPRGKAFYAEVVRTGHIAIVAQTTDFRTCRLKGAVVHPTDAAKQRRLVDWMFELNPGMDELYPGDTRYACEVFYIERGEGDYFDLGRKPLLRKAFAIGEPLDASQLGGFRIDEATCTGCGACAGVCPQNCIARTDSGTYAIVQSACLHCGLCFEACPSGAVEKLGSK